MDVSVIYSKHPFFMKNDRLFRNYGKIVQNLGLIFCDKKTK